MQIIVSKNYIELCNKVANFIVDEIKELSAPLLCFAGGDTPTGVYKNLVKLDQSGRGVFNQANFVGLDEWVGLNDEDSGSCRFTLNRDLYRPLNIKESKIHFFEGKGNDYSKQCEQLNNFIENNGPINLVLLGIGVNGHIGFNEPGSSLESVARLVSLDEITQNVGQKYFETEQKLTQGITLGLKQILETGVIILIASGLKKKPIIKELLTNKSFNPSVPVSSLWKHSNCHLFVDEEAFS